MGQLNFHGGHVLGADRLVHEAVMHHLRGSVVGFGLVHRGLFDVGGEGHLGLAAHAPDIKGAVRSHDIRDRDVVRQDPRLALGAVQGLGDLLDDLMDVVVVHFFGLFFDFKEI